MQCNWLDLMINRFLLYINAISSCLSSLKKENFAIRHAIILVLNTRRVLSVFYSLLHRANNALIINK